MGTKLGFYREQHEETVQVMYQRITKTRPDQEALRSDIDQLILRLICLRTSPDLIFAKLR